MTGKISSWAVLIAPLAQVHQAYQQVCCAPSPQRLTMEIPETTEHLRPWEGHQLKAVDKREAGIWQLLVLILPQGLREEKKPFQPTVWCLVSTLEKASVWPKG